MTKNKQTIETCRKIHNHTIKSSDFVTTNPQNFLKKWMSLLKSTVHKNKSTISVSVDDLVIEKCNVFG